MLKFLNLQPEIFAIDINDSSVKVVGLQKKNNQFLLRSFNESAIPEGIVKEGAIINQEALVKIIQNTCRNVKGKKITTKYVIASLPEEKSFSQVIQMPRMTQEELVKAVPFEAENYIPLPIEKVYLDFQLTSDHKEKELSGHLDVSVNVMPKLIVDSYVTCFKAAGLVPCIMEIESQAIARALIKNGRAEAPVAMIDLGKDNTSFIIFSDTSVRFTTSVPFRANHLTEAIATALEIPADEAEKLKLDNGLAIKTAPPSKKGKDPVVQAQEAMKPVVVDFAEKIKKYINFYEGHASHDSFPSDVKIEKIMLCGGGANLKGLPEFLSEQLGIPVQLGDPFTNIIPCEKGKKCPIIYPKALSYVTAFGLALRAANQDL